MKIINNLLLESVIFQSKFVVHIHNARNTNLHYDLRFIDNKSGKLNSFAFGKDFNKSFTKIVGVRTKDHLIRWLDLKSYRLEVFDQGEVDILISSFKYFKLDFRGKKLKGKYKLFELKTSRGDNWMLVKDK